MSDSDKRTKWGTVLFWVLLLVLVLGGTYAWFTYSQIVTSDTAEARTGVDTLELYVSSTGGDNFKEKKVADIVQVSEVNKENLMPVSTADLDTFLYVSGTTGNMTTGFGKDEVGEYFYKGRIYIKAKASDGKASGKMNLYLDTTDGYPVVQGSETGEILTATRLGLSFDESNPVIFSLSDEESSYRDKSVRTYLNGKDIGDDKVISIKNDVLVSIDDPAQKIKDYSVTITDEDVKLPSKKLFTMEMNKIYQIDVYFYLEGCDADCSDEIGLEDVNIQLAFYGVLN